MDVSELIKGIPGWLEGSDVALFSWFLAAQTDMGITGDLAEVGVYLGRTAVLMGSFLRPGETFTVIDLFGAAAGDEANEHENRTSYRELTRTTFEDNYRRALGTLPQVITGDSSQITAHAAHGRHRFVHVDASHLYVRVREDIRAARTLLHPDGIVAFDDILSPHTPGVQAAIWEAAVTDGLRPVVLTPGKLYATWGDHLEWQDRLVASMPRGLHHEVQEVLGRPLLRVWRSPPGPPSRVRRIIRAITPPAILSQAGRFNRTWRRWSSHGAGSAGLPSDVRAACASGRERPDRDDVKEIGTR